MNEQDENKLKELKEKVEAEVKKLSEDPEVKNQADLIKKQQELTKVLVEKAQKNEHMPWQFIHDLAELASAKFIARANSKVAYGFKQSYVRCMEEYVKSVATNSSNLQLLISCKEMKKCYEFYLEESRIVKDMIKEFRCYVRWGHILDTYLLNLYRPEEDEVDWRTLPITWNPFKK